MRKMFCSRTACGFQFSKCFVHVQHVDSSSQNVFFGIQIKCSTAKISQNCMNQRYFRLFVKSEERNFVFAIYSMVQRKN